MGAAGTAGMAEASGAAARGASIRAPAMPRDPIVTAGSGSTGPGSVGLDGADDATLNGIGGHDAQVTAITLHRFEGVRDRLWAFSQMQWAKAPLAAIPDVGFWRIMGTGGGSGFSTRPDLGTVAILTTWTDGEAALRGLRAPVFEERAGRATQVASLFLSCVSSRGRWAGQGAFEPAARQVEWPDEAGGTKPESRRVAALTRATVRPSMLARFWRRVPAIADAIGAEGAARFSIGMGEVPYLHQVTFSIWDDAEAMRRFSRESATHGEAVRRVAEEGWFSEQLFARFLPLGATGRWNGRPAAEAFGLSAPRAPRTGGAAR